MKWMNYDICQDVLYESILHGIVMNQPEAVVTGPSQPAQSGIRTSGMGGGCANNDAKYHSL